MASPSMAQFNRYAIQRQPKLRLGEPVIQKFNRLKSLAATDAVEEIDVSIHCYSCDHMADSGRMNRGAMNVTINGKPHTIQEPCTLSEVIESKGLEAGMPMGLAVNQKVVPQQQWSHHLLDEGDQILIIRPFQGG